MIETITSSTPPGQTRRAIEAATRGSRPSAPRSSEPHGNRTVTRSATPSKAGRQSLDALGDEDDVGQAATSRPASRAARRVGHRPRVGVDGEDECLRVGGRRGERRPAVAGPEVDDDPPVPAGQVEDLADVRLGGAAADDGAHGRHGATTGAACPPRRPPRRRAGSVDTRPSRSSTTRSAIVERRVVRRDDGVSPSLRTTVRSRPMTACPVPESS